MRFLSFQSHLKVEMISPDGSCSKCSKIETIFSIGARITHAVLLSYALQDESCFPGQDRMFQDLDPVTGRYAPYSLLAVNISWAILQSLSQMTRPDRVTPR
jgi:hypothetical protein